MSMATQAMKIIPARTRRTIIRSLPRNVAARKQAARAAAYERAITGGRSIEEQREFCRQFADASPRVLRSVPRR